MPPDQSAHQQPTPATVQVWGSGCHLAGPCANWPGGRGLRWLVLPRDDCLTDARTLHDALSTAVAHQPGPRSEPNR